MCDIPLNPSHFEKSDDVDRRPHASECVEDDDDICSAAFARRWRGFVVVVHRTFAILAQERAIFFCMFLSYVSCYPAFCDILRLQRLCYLSWLYRKDFVSRQYRHHFATTLRSVLLCGKSTSCKDICSICGVNKPGIKRLTTSSILSLPLTLIAHRRLGSISLFPVVRSLGAW